ncbi:unnamed protein product, partial [Acidocella sp. C78]
VRRRPRGRSAARGGGAARAVEQHRAAADPHDAIAAELRALAEQDRLAGGAGEDRQPHRIAAQDAGQAGHQGGVRAGGGGDRPAVGAEQRTGENPCRGGGG